MEPSKILSRAITGAISLEVRKRLSIGESVRIKNSNGVEMVISIDGNVANISACGEVLASEFFIGWSDADSEYESMIEGFGEDGGGCDTDFVRISNNYHDRFKFAGKK